VTMRVAEKIPSLHNSHGVNGFQVVFKHYIQYTVKYALTVREMCNL